MRPSTRKAFWIGIGAIAALAVTWDFIPLTDASARLKLLPTSGLGFASRELPPIRHRTSGLWQGRPHQALLSGRIRPHHPPDRRRHEGPTRRPRPALLLPWFRLDRHPATRPPHPGRHGAASHPFEERNRGRGHLLAFRWPGTSQLPSRYWWQTALRRLTLGRSGSEPVLIILQPWPGQNISWDDTLTRIGPLFEI